MNFKTEDQIFDELKTNLETQLPGVITEWGPGGIARSLLRAVASALRILYVALESLYWNMWPQYADRQALRRYYEEWGMEWTPEINTETARTTVLNRFRQRQTGTIAWFKNAVLLNFPEVTQVDIQVIPPNRLVLTVSRYGKPLPQSVVSDLQTFFSQDENRIVGIEVSVQTLKEEPTNVTL